MIAQRRLSPFRRAVFWCVERTAVLLGGRMLYRRWFLDPARLVVRDEEVRVCGLPAPLEGFTVVHLSDLHAGPFLGKGALGGVLDRLAELDPDVVCMTGDFVVHGVENLGPVVPELQECRGRRGTFGVFGNHDYKGRREPEIASALAAPSAAESERPGWRFLRNTGRVLEVDGATVGFAGIEDLEEGKRVDVESAMIGMADVDLCVALTHGHQAAPSFARLGAHAILSGHSHGTQVDLPFLRDLGPSHPGLRVPLGGAVLIVSRGLGVIGVPLRFGVPAELVKITFRSASTPGLDVPPAPVESSAPVE